MHNPRACHNEQSVNTCSRWLTGIFFESIIHIIENGNDIWNVLGLDIKTNAIRSLYKYVLHSVRGFNRSFLFRGKSGVPEESYN